MEDKPYSNREIKLMLSEIHKDIKSIIEQTTKTNGRVTSLELWRSYIVGSLAVLTFLGTFAINYLLR